MGQILKLPTSDLRTVATASSSVASEVRPTVAKRVPPGRKSNEDHGRVREWLSEVEIEALITATSSASRYPVRDATAILLCYRHGLRVSELVSMRWSQIDFKGARIHIVRAKHGDDGTHPLTGRELRLLRKLQQEQPLGAKYIFMSERGAPIAPSAAQKVVKMAGKRAFSVHIHMLRHSCGYSLINRGVDLRTVQSYLGHASISSTAVYTHLNATRFDGLWQD